MKSIWLSLSILLVASSVTYAQDVFKAQYVSGKTGFEKKVDGQLVIGADVLTMMDGKKVIFTIPLVNVTKVSNTVENNSGAIGRKLLFGNLANHSEGFVFVNTETTDVAEGITFRVDKKAPAGIMAKIEFAVKKAKSTAKPPL